MNQENLQSLENSEGISLGRYLRLILLQSKLILLITIIGFLIGFSIFFSSDKTYRIKSLLQIYTPNQSLDPRQSLSIDFYNSSDTNLENLITLYTSRSNIINLIKDLNLNVHVEGIEENEILKIINFSYFPVEKSNENFFYLQVKDDIFNLFDDKNILIAKGKNDEFVKTKNLEIKLNFSNVNSEKLIKLTYRNPSEIYYSYKNRINVSSTTSKRSFFSQEGLLSVFLITTDINKGRNIIDAANRIFIKDNINVETEKAKKSIKFIDNQLQSLTGVLDSRKSQLKSFKQENKSLNVNLEVQSIIELISDVEKKINKVNLELSQAEENFTEDNPLYVNLKIQKDALETQKESIEEKIENLPMAQQEYIDLFRELEISEQLYSELINRRLNFSLIEASTIGNIRVVDEAFVERLVGPKMSLIFYFAFFSFFLALVIAAFRGIFFISISNPAELKDAGINKNILGVIPKIEDIDANVKDTRFDQSIETAILNIETAIGQNEFESTSQKCKKIIFTSPTASNGKSFISRYMSQGLSRIGHKVLLIDADLKRGDQHKLFGVETIDLAFFKDLNSENIEKLKIENNLYLLPKLKKLKNTFEYLYGNLFINKINEFENFFDYIIIDTAPALSVSDTGLLMSYGDNNFLIVRHGVNRINEIKQSMQIINQIGRTFDGIIYNGYQKPSGYYGYYDLYGDYSYRYYAERYLYDYYDIEKDD